MGKFNFHFEAGSGRAKSDIVIYSCGGVYVSKTARARFTLDGVGLRWGEDKAQHILALRKDKKAKQIKEGRGPNFRCPAEIARRYVGRYNLKEEEDVLVLYQVKNQESDA